MLFKNIFNYLEYIYDLENLCLEYILNNIHRKKTLLHYIKKLYYIKKL